MSKPENQPTLMDSLKESIKEEHARMEASPFIAALTNGALPLESYVGQLRAMAVIHGTLEHELAQLPSGNIKTLLLDKPSRLVHLRKDLTIFDPMLIKDIEGSLEHTRKMAERIRRYRVGQPAALIGIIYLLQGMTLGNAVHLPDVLKAFGDKTGGIAYYYNGYGDKTAEYWQEFCCDINAIPMDKDGCNRITQVTLDFIGLLEALLSSLYPLENATMIFTAGMLNPEAGDHPIPANAAEIEAAVTAARRCREEFPYFDERYRERGRSFATSDAAWLATLADLPGAQLFSQVDWLGRLLANRGMPRITLERQLELLHECMVAALPAKRDHCKGLLEASESLKKERLRRIPEPAFTDLAQEFYLATDGELQGRFNGTGKMIVSALCDQAAGISEAVTSLLPWLTDAERFSPQWISAVTKTLEMARENLKSD